MQEQAKPIFIILSPSTTVTQNTFLQIINGVKTTEHFSTSMHATLLAHILYLVCILKKINMPVFAP